MNKTACLRFFGPLLLGACSALAALPDVPGELGKRGMQSGIVVQLGCTNASETLALHADGRFVVQVLDRNAQRITTAKKAIRAAGKCGPVSARVYSGQTLPFDDNLLNAVVAEDVSGIAEAEIVRVLRPLGVAWIKQGAGWRALQKPWPEALDEWTHFLHDASGNAVSTDKQAGPPAGLRWKAGPAWGRSHEFNSSMMAMVTASGRLFYVFDYGVTGMEDTRLGDRWTLVARDAFNGTHLWARPLPSWGIKVWRGRALRLLGGTLARRLIADDDRVYCTIDYLDDVHVLDASTGKTLRTIPGTPGTGELLVDGDHVFCVGRGKNAKQKDVARIVCYSKTARKTVWTHEDSQVLTQKLSVGPEAVVYHNRKATICLNRADGAVRWQQAQPQPKPQAVQDKKPQKKKKRGSGTQPSMLLLADGKAILATRQSITALALADGKPVWVAKPGPQGNSMRDSDVFYAQGRIWCSAGSGGIVGYDVKTGGDPRKINVSGVQSQGHHLRCYRAKSTERHLITQFRGVEFLSITDDAHNQNDWVRGACTYGVMPANGLLYQPPHSCFCYPAAMVTGLNALTPRPGRAERAVPPALGPIEKGPAYEARPPSTERRTRNTESSWPAYRRNTRRVGATPHKLPAKLAPGWSAELGTAITPPVAADGRVYVAAKDHHTIHALDAKTGAKLWAFQAGARIDSAPSIHGAVLVFGCADGLLYCIRAQDGQLAWRRRLAPAEKWMAVDGQLESVWRLHGSVAIIDDLAYCSAGRSTFLDGGLSLYAVDIGTGKIKHQTRVNTLSDTRDDLRKPGDFVPAYHIEGGNSDLIVAEGGFVYINQMKFSPELTLQPTRYPTKEQATKPSLNLDNKSYVNEDIFKVRWKSTTYDNYDKLAGILVNEATGVGNHDMGAHLMTTSGFLDDTFFNRTFWMHAPTWPGFNHANLAPKSGQLVVIGDTLTYALKAYTSRYPLSPSYDPEQKGYLLIADRNENDPVLDPRAWAKDKGMGFSRAAPPVWHHWLPVRVKAMVLAGDTIFVCGPPDKVKASDPLAAFEGRMGGEIWALNAATGEVLNKLKTTDVPAFDAMIAAENRLFMCTPAGKILTFAAE